MISERLEEFLRINAHVDMDTSALGQEMREEPIPDYVAWLQDDFASAIRDQDFTPAEVTRLTGIRVPDQAAADDWARMIWGEWFPGAPFPSVSGSS